MPNAKVHAQIGAAAGAASYVAMSKQYGRKMEGGEAGICALVGLAFAAVPDIIEPALTPNHRGTAHSLMMLLFVVAFLVWFCHDQKGHQSEFAKMVVVAAGTGYLTHLMADGCTPKGLPVFC